MAARPRRSISVTNALPFLKKRPPIAGSIAKTRGDECQCEGSLWLSGPTPRFGNTRLLADCLVSSKLSADSIDDLLRGNGGVFNLCVSLKCRDRSRRPGGDEMAEDVMAVGQVAYVGLICFDGWCVYNSHHNRHKVKQSSKRKCS